MKDIVIEEMGKGPGLVVDFMPNWWAKNYNIQHDEKFYFDVGYRIDMDMRMEKLLHQRFGDIGIGNPKPQPHPFIPYPSEAVSAMFGAKLRFVENQTPYYLPLNINDKQVLEMKIPHDIEGTYPMPEIMEKIDYMLRNYGRIEHHHQHLYQHDGGVQNISLKLRGNQLFCDYKEKPYLAEKLFETVSETIVKLAGFVRKKTKTEGTLFKTENCTVSMISPKTYEDFLLKFDNKLAQNFQLFGIHHHGVTTEAHLKAYAKIKSKLVKLDLDYNADLILVRRYFPESYINYILDPVWIHKADKKDITKTIISYLKKGAPLDKLSILAVDLDSEVSDERIKYLYKLITKYAGSCEIRDW